MNPDNDEYIRRLVEAWDKEYQRRIKEQWVFEHKPVEPKTGRKLPVPGEFVLITSTPLPPRMIGIDCHYCGGFSTIHHKLIETDEVKPACDGCDAELRTKPHALVLDVDYTKEVV